MIICYCDEAVHWPKYNPTGTWKIFRLPNVGSIESINNHKPLV